MVTLGNAQGQRLRTPVVEEVVSPLSVPPTGFTPKEGIRRRVRAISTSSTSSSSTCCT